MYIVSLSLFLSAFVLTEPLSCLRRYLGTYPSGLLEFDVKIIPIQPIMLSCRHV